MDTISLWKAITTENTTYAALSENIEVDVAIIGGGITGITAALALMGQNQSVAIFEALSLGEGTTGYSTGNLYIPVQPYFQNVIAKMGLSAAKTVATARNFAINFIEQVVKEKNIACHFARRPWFLYTDQAERLDFLNKEINALKQCDLAIEEIKELPLHLKYKKAIQLKNQARFNPMQYVKAVASDLQKQGCQIFENSRVRSLVEKNHCMLEVNGFKVTAKKVLITTHTPIGINTTQVFTAPYRSYVVSVRLNEAEYPEGHFWDLAQPHHVLCTHAEKSLQPELLMISGSHHKTGQEENTRMHFEKLQQFLAKHFSVQEIAYQWSAQHYQSADTLPYIGLANRSTKHTYIATGFFADGLVYGTLAGLILSDFILQKNNNKDLAEVCNSKRLKPFASFPALIKENSNVFMQYLKDYLAKRSHEYAEIKPGEGKIVEIDKKKWAVSCNLQGEINIVSAVCTHMKCIVHWNNAETSWDCPCHGSRFSCTGKIIEGPAETDLAKFEQK